MISYKKTLLSSLLCITLQTQTTPALEELSLSSKTTVKLNALLQNVSHNPTKKEVRKLIFYIKSAGNKILQKKIYVFILNWALENNTPYAVDLISLIPAYVFIQPHNDTTLINELMMYAISHNKIEIIKALLSKSSLSSLTQPSKNGITPADYAYQLKKPHLAQLIIVKIKRLKAYNKLFKLIKVVAIGYGIFCIAFYLYISAKLKTGLFTVYQIGCADGIHDEIKVTFFEREPVDLTFFVKHG